MTTEATTPEHICWKPGAHAATLCAACKAEFDTDARTTTDAMVRLARLSLDFGRVDRATYHPDGVTRESDTDHTVMLGLVACSLAERHFPSLDVGLVAQLCLVHDAHEVYAGDTPTLRALTAEEKAAKIAREEAAAERIADEFGGSLPWLPDMIAEYESSMPTQEAVFVRKVDKMLPKLTHALNGAVTIAEQGVSVPQLRERLDGQRAELVESLPDMPELVEIWDVLVADLFEMVQRARPAPAGANHAEPRVIPNGITLADGNAHVVFPSDGD